MSHKVAVFLLAFVFSSAVDAQLDKIIGGLGSRNNPSDGKTASGLKEALQIGTDHAVDFTGKPDGFFKNEAIKILLPDKLRTAEKALRFTLSEDVTAAIPPGYESFLEMAMNFAARFEPLSSAERTELLASAKGLSPIFRRETGPAA